MTNLEHTFQEAKYLGKDAEQIRLEKEQLKTAEQAHAKEAYLENITQKIQDIHSKEFESLAGFFSEINGKNLNTFTLDQTQWKTKNGKQKTVGFLEKIKRKYFYDTKDPLQSIRNYNRYKDAPKYKQEELKAVVPTVTPTIKTDFYFDENRQTTNILEATYILGAEYEYDTFEDITNFKNTPVSEKYKKNKANFYPGKVDRRCGIVAITFNLESSKNNNIKVEMLKQPFKQIHTPPYKGNDPEEAINTVISVLGEFSSDKEDEFLPIVERLQNNMNG